MNTPTEQFNHLCAALRAYPERILQLGSYVGKEKNPEEGVVRIEAAFGDVLAHYSAMVGALKADGSIDSFDGHGAIATLIGMRHAVQEQDETVRSLLREMISSDSGVSSVLIEYGSSDQERGRCPFAVSIAWIEEALMQGRYAGSWDALSTYWNLDAVKQEAESKSMAWDEVYMDATSMIAEGVFQLCNEYNRFFTCSSEESKSCYDYFSHLEPLNKTDFVLIA